jgi:hypothetical protein
MTWYFDPENETVDLYDPDGNVVAENVEFSGVWAGGYPEEELRDEVAEHLVSGTVTSTETAILWAFEWLAGDVAEGTPE